MLDELLHKRGHVILQFGDGSSFGIPKHLGKAIRRNRFRRGHVFSPSRWCSWMRPPRLPPLRDRVALDRPTWLNMILHFAPIIAELTALQGRRQVTSWRADFSKSS